MESLTGSPFAPFLSAVGTVVLDGGLATALEGRGHDLADRLWSARLLRDDPDAILDAHRAYLAAGADCVTTASYQASRPGFAAVGLDDAAADELLARSVRLAREAVAGSVSGVGREEAVAGRPAPLVAASVGPWAAWLADGSEYTGRYAAERSRLVDFHAERLAVLVAAAPDLLACETIPNGAEVEVLLELLETVATPAWISFCCGDDGHLWDGTPVESVAAACRGHGSLVALGVNCTAPVLVPRVVERIRSAWGGAIVAYPNSGERYEVRTRSWRGDDHGWFETTEALLTAGVEIVGGCCRVGPDRIARLRARVDGGNWPG